MSGTSLAHNQAAPLSFYERNPIIFRLPALCFTTHGTSTVNNQSASSFKAHVEKAITELSSALIVAQQSSNDEEFKYVQKSVGEIIAALDTMLFDSIYIEHPDLNDLS
jgi:hypothetical protein